MRFWIPVIKASKNNYDDLKENISELISATYPLITYTILVLFNLFYIIFGPIISIAMELMSLRKDSKEIINILAYIRNHEGVGDRFKELAEIRLKTFPNSRVYRVIYRCILNEERKIKNKNMLEEFNQENWD